MKSALSSRPLAASEPEPASEETIASVEAPVIAPAPKRRRAAPRLAVWGPVTMLTLVALAAAIPDLLAPYAPTDMDAGAILSPPGGAHWFGTDQFGRDVLSLVICGARQSVVLGVSAVLVGAGVGVSLGLIAGYAGGWVDMVLMRVLDVWMAIPNILLAIALCTALRPSVSTVVFAVSVQSLPRYARVIRGQAIAVRAQPFIQAARLAGASHFAILRRHVLPHCAGTVLVLATLGLGWAILIGASLSFLGIGVNDERPDWGFLLTTGRGYLTVAWWIVTFPGLALASLTLSVNLLGDALRRRVGGGSGR